MTELWDTLFPKNTEPSMADVAAHINSPLLDEFLGYMKAAYGASPDFAYSGCGMRPGWNLRFRKSSRSLATLYPANGFFTLLVVIGEKQRAEADLIAPTLSAAARDVYRKATVSAGGGALGAWLMIDIREDTALTDAKRLIATRRKPN